MQCFLRASCERGEAHHDMDRRLTPAVSSLFDHRGGLEVHDDMPEEVKRGEDTSHPPLPDEVKIGAPAYMGNADITHARYQLSRQEDFVEL